MGTDCTLDVKLQLRWLVADAICVRHLLYISPLDYVLAPFTSQIGKANNDELEDRYDKERNTRSR